MSTCIHIIACAVFKDALAYLAEWIDQRPFTVTFLPAHLHLNPRALKKNLLNTIGQVKMERTCMGCLYGQCFPDIDTCLASAQALRIPCGYCYEVFLGHQRYNRIMTEQPGTFFVEKELLLDFDNLCRSPLELDDPDMRKMYFTHYQQIIYIRQPLDPDLSQQANSVSNLLNLQLKTVDADYTELKQFLIKLYRYGCGNTQKS